MADNNVNFGRNQPRNTGAVVRFEKNVTVNFGNSGTTNLKIKTITRKSHLYVNMSKGETYQKYLRCSINLYCLIIVFPYFAPFYFLGQFFDIFGPLFAILF